MDRSAIITNRILRTLPPAVLKSIGPSLEWVPLRKGMVINHADHLIKHHYFIGRGMVSLIKTMSDGRTVEVGAVGPEGVTNPGVLLGSSRDTRKIGHSSECGLIIQ